MSILEQVVVRAGRLQSPLRVEDVLAPGLVEADGCVMGVVGQRLLAGRTEAPRAQEARTGRNIETMEVGRSRESRGVPAAGVQVNGVAVARESPGDVGDVSLRAATRRENAFVAESDVHSRHPRVIPAPARRTC